MFDLKACFSELPVAEGPKTRHIAAEIDRKARMHCSDRVNCVLKTCQQFVAVGDVVVRSTQNIPVAGV